MENFYLPELNKNSNTTAINFDGTPTKNGNADEKGINPSVPTSLPTSSSGGLDMQGTKLLVNEYGESVMVRAEKAKQISPEKVKVSKGQVLLEDQHQTSKGNPLNDHNKARVMLDKGMSIEQASNSISSVPKNERERAIAARRE